MSRFNKKRTGEAVVINRQGGEAYQRSAEYRLVTLLLTNFITDQFYRSGNQSLNELEDLLKKVDPLFAAKAAVYARNEFGMRSISHVLAAGLASRASGTEWGKRFYDSIVRRPDDMLEIAAAYWKSDNAGTNLTNAMKKGFASAFDRFDGYQLAKYRNDGKTISLVDIVNMVRPVPTRRNATALQELVTGTLRNRNTWESKLSAAGATGNNQEKEAAKAEAWSELLITNRLGYFALIRNLRNMLLQSPACIDLVVEQLQDPVRIRKSLVLPFRLLTAYREVQGIVEPELQRENELMSALRGILPSISRAVFSSLSANKRRVLAALERAIDISCGNLPNLPNTLVAIDNSGSMGTTVGGSKTVRCNELGALFGFALAKRSNADLMEFGTTARLLDFNLNKSTLEFAAQFAGNNRVGHGTNFQAIFEKAGRKSYERIVILSDMQSGLHQRRGKEWLTKYTKESGSTPYIYTLDLSGYGTSQFPAGSKVFELAGFSEKVFDLMQMAEQDPEVLLHAVADVEL